MLLKVAMMQTTTPTKPSTLTFTKTPVTPVMEVDLCPPGIWDGPHTVSYELAGVSAIMRRYSAIYVCTCMSQHG